MARPQPGRRRGGGHVDRAICTCSRWQAHVTAEEAQGLALNESVGSGPLPLAAVSALAETSPLRARLSSPAGKREVPGSLYHLVGTEQGDEETDYCGHVCGGDAGDTHVGDRGGGQRGGEYAGQPERVVSLTVRDDGSAWCRSRWQRQPHRSDSVWMAHTGLGSAPDQQRLLS